MRSAAAAIARCLDAGYSLEPAQMLDFFLDDLFERWGLPRSGPATPDKWAAKTAEAIAAYLVAVTDLEPFQDVLGDVYMELGSRGRRQGLGQFFTPWPVASVMAKISLGAPPKGDRLVTCCDPACGAGVMMLALANAVLRHYGSDALRAYSFTGCDLDLRCARMMAAQFLANCEAHDLQVGEIVVYCGNSLCPGENLRVILHATAPSVPKVRLVPAAHPARIEALSRAAEAKAGQLELFA